MWAKQCHFYHPWLGMVLIQPIYGDDWGMFYGIVLPTLKKHLGWGLNIYPVGPGIKLHPCWQTWCFCCLAMKGVCVWLFSRNELWMYIVVWIFQQESKVDRMYIVDIKFPESRMYLPHNVWGICPLSGNPAILCLVWGHLFANKLLDDMIYLCSDITYMST